MELYGKKVKLRAIEESDLEMLRSMKNDPWTEEMVVGWCPPISTAMQKKWFDSISLDNNKMLFVIETKEEGAVGYTCLINIDWKNRKANGGIMIKNKRNMSKGIATDTYMTILRYAFMELNLNRINGSILDYNKASQHVLLDKVGYHREGVQRQAIYKNGQYHDLIMIGILKEDYMKKIDETGYWKRPIDGAHEFLGGGTPQ